MSMDGKDQALGDAQQKAVDDEEPVIADDAGERGEDSPTDERKEDETRRAFSLRVGSGRHLEEEVAEKEDRAEEGGARFGDVERAGKAGRGAEAEVGAAKVGEAIGKEDDRHQEEPAPAQFERMPVWGGGIRGFDRRLFFRHRSVIASLSACTLGRSCPVFYT